jgi:hypothetical protein
MALDVQNLGSPPPQQQQQQQQGTPPSSGDGKGVQGDASAAKTAADRPEWLPENFWDGEKNAIKEDFGSHFNELATFKQAEADRIAAMKLPEKPEEYPLGLPEDFQFPDGITAEDIAVATDAPEFKEAQQVLHEAKVDPAVAKKLYGAFAKFKLGEVKRVNERIAEEKQKLGPDYQTRFQKADQFLSARLGIKPGTSALMKAVVTADAVKEVEKLAAAFASQGAPPVPPGGHSPEPDGKIPGYENMSFEEKRLHQQKRAAAG